jgi:hypothetical protein
VGPQPAANGEFDRTGIDMSVASMRTHQFPTLPDNLVAGIAFQTVSRFTGPFSPFEFEQIQVLLREGAGAWYYNDYFSHVNAAVYRKYYFPLGLGDPANSADAHRFPSTPPPVNTSAPGSNPQREGASTSLPPSSDGAAGILLTLKEARYSHRFGGSLMLAFAMEEEFAYEFRFGRLLYDIPELEMMVYVIPVASLLNPTPMPPPHLMRLSGPNAVAISVEFRVPEEYSSYEWLCNDSGGDPVPIDDPCPTNGSFEGISPVPANRQNEARVRLIEDLHLYSSDLVASMQNHASAFVYGFLHDLHSPTLLNESVRPDRIAISDNHFELVTHQGEPIFNVMYRVVDFDAWSGVIWAKPEISGRVLSITGIEDSDFRLEKEVHTFSARPGKIKVEDGDTDTPWVNAGSFSYWDVESYIQNVRNTDSSVGPDDDLLIWYQIPYEARVKMKWDTILSTTSATYALWAYGWPFYEFVEEFLVLSDQPNSGSIQNLVNVGNAKVLFEKSYEMWDAQPPEHNLQMTLLFRVTLNFR